MNEHGRKTMKQLRKEELLPLKQTIEKALALIKNLNLKEMPYFMKFLERMRCNLRTCILVEYEGWEQLEYTLKRDWKAANHIMIGIPSFQFPDTCTIDEKRMQDEFKNLVIDIEFYVNG